MCTSYLIMKTPRRMFDHRGEGPELYTTSENAQMLCLPGPFYGLRHVCEWHYPGPGKPPKSRPQALPSWGHLYGHPRNQPASAAPAKIADPEELPGGPDRLPRRHGGP